MESKSNKKEEKTLKPVKPTTADLPIKSVITDKEKEAIKTLITGFNVGLSKGAFEKAHLKALFISEEILANLLK